MITTAHFFTLTELKRTPRMQGGWSIKKTLPRFGKIRHINFNDQLDRFQFYVEFDETAEQAVVERELVVVPAGQRYQPETGKRLELIALVTPGIFTALVVCEQRPF